MNKKNIALFGGAFDPITIAGHLNIAKEIKKYTNIQEIWIMPTFISQSKKLTNYSHRKKMIEILIKKYNFIKIFDYEKENNFNGKTYDLLKTIKKDTKYSDCNFYFVIGLDNANNIESWYRYQDVIEEIPFLIIKRPKYKIDNNAWYNKEPHRIIEADITTDISSTYIRDNIKDNKMKTIIEKNISKENFKYIIKNKLYN